MNSNIEVINENLYAVNFHFITMGYIKELTLTNQETVQKLAFLSEDGKYYLNKAVAYEAYVPFIQAIMKLNDGAIYTKQGFCNVIREVAPSFKKMTDKQIIKFVWSDNSITGNWTIYQNLCKWEFDRRKVQKDFIKQHPFLSLIRKIRKGVKLNGKY